MELPWLFVCLFVFSYGGSSLTCVTRLRQKVSTVGVCAAVTIQTPHHVPEPGPGGALLESAAMPGHPSQGVGGMSKPVSCMRLHARAPDCPD